MINKKRALIFLILIPVLFLIILTLFQESTSASTPSDTPKNFRMIENKFNPETGLPKSYEKFSEMGEFFVKREQNKSYLAKSWTGLAAKNKFLGPILFYTEKFFAFFNPLWEYSFGTEFTWSLVFFFHLIIWGALVFILFFPLNELIENSFFGLIISIIIASITGAFGMISIVVEVLETMLVNLWYVTLFFIVIILILWLYDKLFIKLKKESHKEKLERADKARESAGEVAEKFLNRN